MNWYAAASLFALSEWLESLAGWMRRRGEQMGRPHNFIDLGAERQKRR